MVNDPDSRDSPRDPNRPHHTLRLASNTTIPPQHGDIAASSNQRASSIRLRRVRNELIRPAIPAGRYQGTTSELYPCSSHTPLTINHSCPRALPASKLAASLAPSLLLKSSPTSPSALRRPRPSSPTNTLSLITSTMRLSLGPVVLV